MLLGRHKRGNQIETHCQSIQGSELGALLIMGCVSCQLKNEPLAKKRSDKCNLFLDLKKFQHGVKVGVLGSKEL